MTGPMQAFRSSLGLLAGSLAMAALLSGCHGDTDQGGGTDRGGATTAQQHPQQQRPVPTPPTADQVDPSSPRAVLGGTSTTQPAVKSGTGSTPTSTASPRPPQ